MAHSASESNHEALFRPARVCEALLAALEASQGRRRMRKRDQTPDAFGLDIKRRMLEDVVRTDPDSDAFEQWLLHYTQAWERENDPSSGAAVAMARAIFDEWRLAHAMRDFALWLEKGAPSQDAGEGTPRRD
jgi:hypothetical protein